MSAVYIVVFCIVVSAAMTVLLLGILFLGRRREVNQRAHNLGRLLMCSHPEWN